MSLAANAIRKAGFVLGLIGALALLPMIFLTVADVTGRKFLVPVTGASEITEVGLLIIIFCGAAYVSRERGHIAIELVVSRLGPRRQAIVHSFNSLLAAATCAIMSWMTALDAIAWLQTNRRTDNLSLPLYPFKLTIAVGTALLALDLLVWFAHYLRQAARGEE